MQDLINKIHHADCLEFMKQLPDKCIDLVLTYNLTPAQIHPTQKPVPLISFLMERASKPGALVLDPFAGSGTTAVAAYRLGRRFICVEKNADYHAAASRRIEDEMKQQMLNF